MVMTMMMVITLFCVQCSDAVCFLTNSYSVGLIPTKQSLALANNVNASSFCRYVKGWVLFLEHQHSRWCFKVTETITFPITPKPHDWLNRYSNDKVAKSELGCVWLSFQEAVAVGDAETAHGSEHEERHHFRRAGTYPSHTGLVSSTDHGLREV